MDAIQTGQVQPANYCGVPSLNPDQYAVMRAGMSEAIAQPLYHYQDYGTGGAAQYTFFQVPLGTATNGLEDTNMQNAGILPSPQKFLVQAIYVDFLSGLATSAFGAQSANTPINDVNFILRRGWLTFSIGQKDYFTMAPLMALPPRAHIGGVAALSDATTAGAALQGRISVGYSEGDVFRLRPFLIDSTVNFSVKINFAAAVAPPSATTGRIGVVMLGTFYRPLQ